MSALTTASILGLVKLKAKEDQEQEFQKQTKQFRPQKQHYACLTYKTCVIFYRCL